MKIRLINLFDTGHHLDGMLVGGIVVSPDQEDDTDVGPIYEALDIRDFSDVIQVCLVEFSLNDFHRI